MHKIKQKIVHVVHREKFTSGYINFMKIAMPEYDHWFITRTPGFELDLVDYENVILVQSFNDLLFGANNKLLHQSDKIVFTGLFKLHETIAFLNKKILKKTYLHFWGGDFYWAKDCGGIKAMLKKPVMQYLINGCAGTVNLIEGDIQELAKLFPNRTKHYVAPMPGCPRAEYDYQEILNETQTDDKVRIIIGNSATSSNCHADAFRQLERFRDCGIEVYCPLSYGNKQYCEQVIELGTSMFGDAFHAVQDYMDKEAYIRFLATFDVGIFCNDRQQALGNIKILLGLGKKIYLRKGTSMWDYFQKTGLKVAAFEDISQMSMKEFVHQEEEDQKQNMQIREQERKNAQTNSRACWQSVLG